MLNKQACSLRPCAARAQTWRAVQPRSGSVQRTALRAAAEEVEVATNSNGASPASSTATNMLEFDELSDIIRMVHNTDIVEFELKSKRFSLSVKKKEALKAQEVQVIHAAAPSAAPVAAPAPAPAPAPAAAPAPAPAAAAAAPAPAPKVAEGIEVTSPMSGTLYRSPAPGEPAFVKEGDRVTKGQTICLIEAMKLMNEIEAEVSGEVVAFLTDNGQAVSPGQPIVLIKP